MFEPLLSDLGKVNVNLCVPSRTITWILNLLWIWKMQHYASWYLHDVVLFQMAEPSCDIATIVQPNVNFFAQGWFTIWCLCQRNIASIGLMLEYTQFLFVTSISQHPTNQIVRKFIIRIRIWLTKNNFSCDAHGANVILWTSLNS